MISWKLTKLVINGFLFFTSDPINSINIVHQSTTTCSDHKRCLGQHLSIGENTLFIHHDSPLLAGLGETFVQDIHAHGELLVVGEPQQNPVLLIGGGVQDFELELEKIGEDFNVLVKRNTPFAIFIIIAIIVIVIAIAVITFKVAETTGNVSQVSSDIKGVT